MSGFRPRFFLAQDGLASASADPMAVGDEVMLSAADSHHAIRVLRLKAGDECEVVLGAAVYAATVRSAKTQVGVTLTARLEGVAAGAVYHSQVGLVQALTRPALLDQVLEKGTEVGASFFVVVPAAESVRLPESSLTSRLERWRRIVLEAAKQSKQAVVPTVEMATSVEAAIDRLRGQAALSYVLEPSASVSLADLLEASAAARVPAASRSELPAARVALWIGPESGWAKAELERFGAAGMECAKLGQSVLRAETAGPVAVAATRLVLRDW